MEDTKQLTTREIAFAATNDPALAATEFTLGERTFKVLNLPYEDYVKFLGHLQPVLEGITAGAANKPAEGESDFGIGTILKHCADVLPHMVQLSAKQTDPTITVERCKELCPSPLRMATIVLKQIQQNRIVSDIADFFVLMLPVMSAIKGAMKTTKATL
jgi:hypothetical protein